MLRKLIKYELRATGRVMLPLYLVLMITAVGAGLTTRGLLETKYRILDVLGGLLIAAFVIAMIAVCVISFVMMIRRFYMNLLRDEGYLSLTLPVSVHQQVWAKLLTSIIWFVATGIAAVLAVCLMTLNVGDVAEFFQGVSSVVSELWQNMSAYYALNGTAILIELLVLIFVGLAAFCLRFYSALAIGHSFANHKMLLSIVFFLIIGAILQTIGTFGVSVLSLEEFEQWIQNFLNHSGGAMAMTHLTFAVLIFGQLVLGGIYYFLTTRFLKKHLNLE